VLKVLCLLTFTCDASNLTVCIESLLDDDDEHEVDTIGQEDAEFLLSEHIDNMSDKKYALWSFACFLTDSAGLQCTEPRISIVCCSKVSDAKDAK
jgi:hypothetical protein